MRGAIFTIVLCAFLGGLGNETKPGELGRLLSLEEVGAVLQGKLKISLGSKPSKRKAEEKRARGPCKLS